LCLNNLRNIERGRGLANAILFAVTTRALSYLAMLRAISDDQKVVNFVQTLLAYERML
jgi:hypothetical protein